MNRIVRGWRPLSMALGIATMAAGPVAAQMDPSRQQMYAAAFLGWDVSQGGDNIALLDQELWIAAPAPSTQWVVSWDFTGIAPPNNGGYLGINQDANGNAQMLFSLWHAIDAVPGPLSACAPFGGEGTGRSCRQPIELRKDRFYRLHLQRDSVDDDGVWWRATIAREDPDGAPVVVDLGSIKVASARNRIRGASLLNFIEYFGPPVAACSSVPVAGFYAAPPQLGTGASVAPYDLTATYRSVTGYDKCPTGTENQGASYQGQQVGVLSQDWPGRYPEYPPATNGGMVFLGGATAKHSLAENAAVITAVPPRTILLFAPGAGTARTTRFETSIPPGEIDDPSADAEIEEESELEPE